MVSLTLTPSPHIIDDSPRDASLRVISIDLEFPEAVVNHAMQIGLSTHSPNIAILANSSSVVSHSAILLFAHIAELILAAGRKEFC